jgi:glycosyltransferase involved in cell wall biosynthesis
LRIAILGTRGVPARYGGFESFADEFGTRLAQRGHSVTVYCRNRYLPGGLNRHNGMKLVRLPAVPQKHLETLSHTLLSALHAALRKFDIVYICNSANAPICFVPWARGQTTILNVDGLEWRRAKWGRLASAYYRWAASLAARMPIEVVTDAHVIQEFYRTELKRETRCIAYGTNLWERGSLAERLGPMGLEPDKYLLYVSRMEPENNALLVVQAYCDVQANMPLVLVGDAPYAPEYVERVKAAADSRVRFAGYVYGDDYHALSANAYLHIQATEVGGTHPALVEAMGHGNAILAQDVLQHREVLGDAGSYFGVRDRADLSAKILDLLQDPDLVARYRLLAAQRAAAAFSWEAITSEYESYFAELLDQKRSRSRA